MSLGTFNEAQFKARVSNALDRARTVLDNERSPAYAADVAHEYHDKYVLGEFLTATAIAAVFNALSPLGLNGNSLAKMREWASTRSVSLRLKSEESCKFLRKVEREVKSDTTYVTESTLFGKDKSYTITKVTEWFWQFDVQWQLVAYQGTDIDKAISLCSRNGSVELKTTTESSPRSATVVRPNIDVNISWFLQHIDKDGKSKFTINRDSKSCHTPRRNVDVESALSSFSSFHSWAGGVHSYFLSTVFPTQPDHGLDLSVISSSAVFVPVQPLFDRKAGATETPSVLTRPFLDEQIRSLEERFKAVNKTFPDGGSAKLISSTEAKLCVALLHAKDIAVAHSEGVNYIEDMLRKQLIAAIGKEVQPHDLSHYLAFHHRKLFKSEYQPKAFSYAIRRPDHYPEGTLSVEADLGDGQLADPIPTFSHESTATRPMRFALDASTNVRFYGERHLHGFIAHKFSNQTELGLSLVARARQFSSFIILVGRIAGADLFEPKFGMIVKDKDELKLPLSLETIPTPKEFRDAIESLSPEQQRFAKAFRSMQLEATLFGVLVIQIKPQLEKLLRIPNDSLTKEIGLTQDLLSLFIEYQIPSDLLSYDGDDRASLANKVSAVKGYVTAMQAMIDKSKKTQLTEAAQRQQMRFAENDGIDSKNYVEDRKREYKEVHKAEKQKDMPRREMQATAQLLKRDAAPAAAVSSTPTPKPHALATSPLAPQTTEIKQPQQKQSPREPTEGAGADETEIVDFTQIPNEMEAKFDKLDEDGALRPTIINTGPYWTKRYKKSLLAEMESSALGKDEQGKERNRTFDLLDALTKSGALSVDAASLHVVIAATHCFDKSVMNTLIQDNINPIEKLERSALIVASCVQQVSPQELIAPEQLVRVGTYSPMLIDNQPHEHREVIGLAKSSVAEMDRR